MASADDNARELFKREEKAFGAKDNLHGLWQEQALNFYPQRADFNGEIIPGEEFASELYDSEPLRCRRDLADARSAMLRPEGQKWVKAETRDEELNERPDIARMLDYINDMFLAFLNDRKTGFNRSEKEVDNDEVTFGNSCQTVESEVNRNGNRNPVIRTWHPRDCAWYDDLTGVTQDVMFRRFKASARHIKSKFPKADLHESIINALENDKDQKFDLCHVMMPADEYEWYEKPRVRRKAPWASIYYDSTHKRILRETPSERFRYVVRRWMTIPGSQYGYSPASMIALPDARSLQMMVMVLLEAGEKSLDPPLKGTEGAVKSDINLGAGNVTWVDKNYDERLGPAIEALLPEMRNLPIGIDLITRTTIALRDNFYLSKLRLPMQSKTAFETEALLAQFLRENLPLFSPWQDGLSSILDEVLAVLFDMKFFGPMNDWPKELSDEELVYSWSNPLRDAIKKAQTFQGQQVLGTAAAIEQIKPGSAARLWNIDKIAQDMTRGTGAPADWLNDEEYAKEAGDVNQEQADILGAMGMAGQAAQVIETGANAAATLAEVGQTPAADGTVVSGPV
jgi:hypothetical protein